MNPYVLAMNGKCPYCGQGPLFDGWIGLHETCSDCGARYLRAPGAWVGPTTIGYGVGATVGVGLGALLVVTGHYFDGAEFVISAIACAVTLVAYRWAKAWWMGYLCAAGYIYPDPPANDVEAAGPTGEP